MWFSNPNCPRCGRESVLATAWDGDYYTCPPCNRAVREEQEEKKAQEQKIADLEERLKKLEQK